MRFAGCSLLLLLLTVGVCLAQYSNETNSRLSQLLEEFMNKNDKLDRTDIDLQFIKRHVWCSMMLNNAKYTSRVYRLPSKNYFYFYNNIKLNTLEAAKHCDWLGLQLVQFESLEEMSELAAAITSEAVAVGASDVGRAAGEITWADGTPVAANFWAPGFPKEFAEGQRTCAYLNKNSARLMDRKCADVRAATLCRIPDLLSPCFNN